MTTSTAAVATDLVVAERRGPVLLLTLNRPDRLNSWTDALEERYFARLDEAEDDPDVRAIVVTGAVAGPRIESVIREQASAAGISYEAVYEEATKTTPLRRLIPPEDIAVAAIFLASDASASTTGEDLNVSGGLAMH